MHTFACNGVSVRSKKGSFGYFWVTEIGYILVRADSSLGELLYLNGDFNLFGSVCLHEDFLAVFGSLFYFFLPHDGCLSWQRTFYEAIVAYIF